MRIYYARLFLILKKGNPCKFLILYKTYNLHKLHFYYLSMIVFFQSSLKIP